jgi:uncharacterized membrane protein (UPF0127 family)
MTRIKPSPAGAGPATRSRRWLQAALTVLTGFCALTAGAQTAPQPRLPTISLTAGLYRITAEVASTPMQRQLGMMMRTEMSAQEGMLFVFEAPDVQCFWMRNTLLPLTAAFVADDGRIVNLADMQPRTDKSHCSKEPVRYVLEMNQGWFAKRGIKPGDRLRGQPFQP